MQFPLKHYYCPALQRGAVWFTLYCLAKKYTSFVFQNLTLLEVSEWETELLLFSS